VVGGVELGLSGYPRFNSPVEIADCLKDLGFDIVSMANNHVLDKGEIGVLKAIQHWKERGIKYVGAYESIEDQKEIRVIEKKNIKLAFLSYTKITNGLRVPIGKDYLVNYINITKIEEDVRLAKEKADFVIVSVHVGTEYKLYPNEYQMTLVKQLADLGVDVYLGHHPHVLQPFNWTEGENGHKMFTAFSLGNFFSGQTQDYVQIGGILKLDFRKTTKNNQTVLEILNPSFTLTYVSLDLEPMFLLTPMKDLENLRDVYTEMQAHLRQWMPELKVI